MQVTVLYHYDSYLNVTGEVLHNHSKKESLWCGVSFNSRAVYLRSEEASIVCSVA
jgi:hypothetical protein